jgi:glycosyltransferase involved in cell wall biosynthesis
MSAPASQTAERKVDLVLKKPRSSILLLESKFVIGGSGRITYDVVRRLDGRRYRPVICTLYEPGEVGEWFIKDGYRFYSRLITHRYDPRAFGKLRSIIEREHVELVLLINQPLTCFWGFIISKYFRIPVVAAVHNKFLGEQSPKLRFNRFLMNRMDVILAVAQGQKDHLVTRQYIRKDIVRVVYNGIDLDEFKPRVKREEQCRLLGLNSKAPIVGTVARLVHLKGVDVFLKAAEIVLKKFSSTQFVIVGDGPEAHELKRMAQALGIASSVRFLGSRGDVADTASVFNVGVLSSRTEGLPMAVLEYMSLSIPVVATNVGGVSEMVGHGETGLLIPEDNPFALAGALEVLLSDRHKGRKMGLRGRAKVESCFQISNTVSRTEQLFEKLLRR